MLCLSLHHYYERTKIRTPGSSCHRVNSHQPLQWEPYSKRGSHGGFPDTKGANYAACYVFWERQRFHDNAPPSSPKDFSITSLDQFSGRSWVISKLTRMDFKILICNNPVLFQSVLTKSVVFNLGFPQETLSCCLDKFLYRILKQKTHKMSFAPRKFTLSH